VPPPLAVEEEVQPDVLHNDCRKLHQSRCGFRSSSRTDWMSSFMHPLTPAADEVSASTARCETSQPETAAIASPVSLSTETMTILGIS
jgi:hypothetical protein